MKSLFLIALALSAVAAQNSCTPGAIFKAGCNTCICSSNGRSAVCTKMVCPPEGNANISDFDTAHILWHCVPNTIFKPDNCNICICNKEGTIAICTKIYCHKPENQKSICKAGSQCDEHIWNKDRNFKIIKTIKNPVKTDKKKKKKICVPNSYFKKDCNTCSCSPNGFLMQCSMMTCYNSTHLEQHNAYGQKTVCKPNSYFKEDCNDCFCSTDGMYKGCTEMECPHNVSDKKQICKPKSSFKEECNSCTCSEDGKSKECTDMYCISDIKKPSTKPSKKQICVPNSTFDEDCNQCTCSEDGTFKECTDEYCETSTEEKSIESEIASNK